MRLTLVLLMAVAGCAGAMPPPDPVIARLYSDPAGDRLEVRFSDGARCRAVVPVAGGQGAFDGCPQARGYVVHTRHRNLLEPIFGSAVGPYADISVTAASGRVFGFVSPAG